MEIPEKIKNELKKPLGQLITLEEIKKTEAKRIISVGDVCTLNLIFVGITPHLAVFDHLYMRRKLEADAIAKLKSKFANPKKYKNQPGTISEELINDAEKILEEGGAVLIEGEEDLTALAFILVANENDIIVYGQPNEGMVMVIPDKEIKNKIKNWLATAALGHEVKGDESKD
ncbi:MAG: DUF359 domain-containing protein [Candidatus Micrarchaeota archaeon]